MATRAYYWCFPFMMIFAVAMPAAHATSVFNGTPQNQRDDLGYYTP